MIRIGTKAELYKVTHLPIAVKNAITEDVRILDDSYGADRDIDGDMGGFVVVCEKNDVLKIANFDRENEVPEFLQVICPYVKKLYISGSERNIIIYERTE